MTEAIYLKVTEMAETAHKTKRRVSVYGMLKRLGVSRSGYHACIESFHSLIKREWLNRFKIRDYDHAYRLVFEYLEAFCHTKRIHSHCDYMSPNDYEEPPSFSKLGITVRQTGI